MPPQGGEADYHLDFELPGVPQPGDCVSIARSGQRGTEDFIVRRTWWDLQHPDGSSGTSAGPAQAGTARRVTVECEFARSPYSSRRHNRKCDAYDRGGLEVKGFDETAY